MGKIVSFVTDYGTFTFPDTAQALDDNFKTLLTRSDRVPGASGGVDAYGTGSAPAGVGQITFSFYLVSRTTEGMDALRITAGQMRDWQWGQLYFQPTDLTRKPRWAFCRIKSLTDGQQLQNHTDRFQQVNMTFEASEPFWYGTGGNERFWNDGLGVWDDGNFWDGSASASAPVTITTSGTYTVDTNNGNVRTVGRVLLINNGGSPFSNPIVQRIHGGEIVDQIKYWGAVAAGDWLEFDPRSHRAMLGLTGADVYDSCEFANPDWMSLLPGANSLQVYVSGAADVAVRFMERYVT